MAISVPLDVTNAAAEPIEQFRRWFADAQATSLEMPESMALATVNGDGVPSVRTVLCKGFDEEGFVFYTNYTSDKAQAIAENPRVELLFYWEPLARQVRISGEAVKLSPEASNAYFQQRPRGSQLAAWASPQSQVVESRDVLEAAYQEQEQRFSPSDRGEGVVPCPPFWGGFRVKPHKIEFWQGRDHRFHDRICYTKAQAVDAEDVERWDRHRLAP